MTDGRRASRPASAQSRWAHETVGVHEVEAPGRAGRSCAPSGAVVASSRRELPGRRAAARRRRRGGRGGRGSPVAMKGRPSRRQCSSRSPPGGEPSVRSMPRCGQRAGQGHGGELGPPHLAGVAHLEHAQSRGIRAGHRRVSQRRTVVQRVGRSPRRYRTIPPRATACEEDTLPRGVRDAPGRHRGRAATRRSAPESGPARPSVAGVGPVSISISVGRFRSRSWRGAPPTRSRWRGRAGRAGPGGSTGRGVPPPPTAPPAPEATRCSGPDGVPRSPTAARPPEGPSWERRRWKTCSAPATLRVRRSHCWRIVCSGGSNALACGS